MVIYKGLEEVKTRNDVKELPTLFKVKRFCIAKDKGILPVILKNSKEPEIGRTLIEVTHKYMMSRISIWRT